MSVLIKGMEMPDGCNTCQLRDLRFNYYVCRAKKLEDGFYLDVDDVVGRRHRYCPLVEIPTPHGRLIDAEKFIDLLEDSFCGDYCIKEHKCAVCRVNMIVRIVKNESTIIEAEVSK